MMKKKQTNKATPEAARPMSGFMQSMNDGAGLSFPCLKIKPAHVEVSSSMTFEAQNGLLYSGIVSGYTSASGVGCVEFSGGVKPA
tara:strand:+ start:388 stop:642 length:255 start_codon:yes stop_codon:yes gene_type:complete